jgi:hypothetical protein
MEVCDTGLGRVFVGAGPVGLACALAAKQAGLRCEWIAQADSIGGATANFLKRERVLTTAIRLPMATKLRARCSPKEELLELWQGLTAKHMLTLTIGRRLTSGSDFGPKLPLPMGGADSCALYSLAF